MKTSRYFTVRDRDRKQVVEKLNKKYGESYRILNTKEIDAPGFRRLMGIKWVESSGIVLDKDEAQQAREARDSQSRDAILASVGMKIPRKEANLKFDEQSFNNEDVMLALKDIKEQLSIGISTQTSAEPFPVLGELGTILRENEFDEAFINVLLSNFKKQFTVEDLGNRHKMHNAAMLAIAELVKFPGPDKRLPPRIFVLIGPTGVGKTTTIAKLAAVYGLLNKKQQKVCIITVDYFRLAAHEQLKAYGDVMDLPVKTANNYEQLKEEIALAADAGLILIDTIGSSPKDKERINEMRSLLSACGKEAEMHLAISATTKTTDIREIFRQFKDFNYNSIIVTKLDETSRIGSVLSAIGNSGKTVSYITNGQGVPLDIAIASPNRLFEKIEGLDFDSDVLEQFSDLEDITGVWKHR